MQLDLQISRFDWAGGPSGIGAGFTDLVQHADAIGLRGVSVMDHFFQMDSVAPATDPMLECYTALAFVAGCTQKVRLRAVITGVTYRHPGILAKIIATLDVLSRGRAELGIGAAWYEREHRGLGVPFPPTAERFERLEEAIQICLQMWSDDDGSYTGRHYQLEETICSPRPVSAPRPRVMIGGSGERKTLRLVAQYADACNIPGGPEEVAPKIDVLRRHCDAIGRDPNEIEITVRDRGVTADATAADVVRVAETFGKMGVSAMILGAVGDDPAAWLDSSVTPVLERITAIEPARL